MLAGIGIDSFGQGGTTVAPVHDVFTRDHNKARTPMAYAPVREADVHWSKRVWRVIDFRQKINHPFYYPLSPQNGRKSFMSTLWEAIQQGQLTVYNVTGTADDNFVEVIQFDQLINSLSKRDTIWVSNPNPPYNLEMKVIDKPFDPSKIQKIRIKEDWFFDKQRSVLDVRIIGICPILDDYDEQDNYRGDKPLFWIYFPEARNVFAQADVYNRGNDAKRITYDDLFAKRMFGSYIYKEQNVYDRKINEYALGLDALLEAERVKEEIFIKEHDLWEF